MGQDGILRRVVDPPAPYRSPGPPHRAPAAARDTSPAACAPCHRAQTEAFAQSAMTRALETGPNAAILRANPKLTATLGAYSYEIARSGDRFLTP